MSSFATASAACALRPIPLASPESGMSAPMRNSFVACVFVLEGAVVAFVVVVHPVNTVANKIVAINMINNCFFIAIPSLGGIFSPVRGYSQK